MRSVSCLAPRELHNYRGRSFSVLCYGCALCLNRRAAVRSDLLRSYVSSRPDMSMLFVTLTYSDDNLPVYRYDEDGEDYVSNRAGRKLNYKVSGQKVERYVRLGVDDLAGLAYRKEVGGYMHLDRTDLDLFFKRLRFCVGKKYGISFKYSVCGEYGPRTLRPHYHAVLFFSEQVTGELYPLLQQDIYKSWSLGRVDTQRVTSSGVSSYLSNYIAGSSSVSISDYGYKQVRPFFYRPSVGYSVYLSADEIEALARGEFVKRAYYDEHEKATKYKNLPGIITGAIFPKKLAAVCVGVGSLASLLEKSYKLGILEKSYKDVADFVSVVCMSGNSRNYPALVAPVMYDYARQSYDGYSYSIAWELYESTGVLPFSYDIWTSIRRAVSFCVDVGLSWYDYAVAYYKYQGLYMCNRYATFVETGETFEDYTDEELYNAEVRERFKLSRRMKSKVLNDVSNVLV